MQHDALRQPPAGDLGLQRLAVVALAGDVEHRLRDRLERVDVEHAQIDWNRIAEDMAPMAEKRVHARLLLDAIADERNLAVTEEEFERTLAVLARAQGVSTPVLRRKLDEDGRLTSLRAQLRREKTIRTLLGEPDEETPAAPGLTAG